MGAPFAPPAPVPAHDDATPTTNPRFRGGMPPIPPEFEPDRDKDPQAFRRWVDRVRRWELRIVHYVPRGEAALILFDSLKGEAALVVQDVPLASYFTDEGIDVLIELLRPAFDERPLLFKAQVFEEFQEYTRLRGEDIRTAVNRYARVEGRLRLVGGEPPANDYRAYKLLQAMKLPPAEHRQITEWDYNQIRDSLLFIYPTKRYVPVLWDDRRGRNDAQSSDRAPLSSAASSRAPSSASGRSFSSRGGKGFGKSSAPRRTYVADASFPEEEYEEDEEFEELDPEEYDPESAPPQHEEEDEDDDLSWVHEALTVAAKKLRPLTNGRNWSTRPSSTGGKGGKSGASFHFRQRSRWQRLQQAHSRGDR